MGRWNGVTFRRERGRAKVCIHVSYLYNVSKNKLLLKTEKFINRLRKGWGVISELRIDVLQCLLYIIL